MGRSAAAVTTLLRPARLACVLVVTMAWAAAANAQATDTIRLRDHQLTLHLYGTRGGAPVIVSSGDGGWLHLGPDVATLLASRGYFVVGFDVKAYLESFTSGSTTLRTQDVPGDYRTLVAYAAHGSVAKPVLVGVSEGAGLSVLAAGDAATKALLGGVVALGLPDVNELGWRWKDALIYVTHGIPKEPTFNTRDVVAAVAPLPLAAIHSTNDEFVPLSQARELLARAGHPATLWVVTARDHRFSDNRLEFERRLTEALAWIAQNQPQ
jgi:type IV secretory pathway VirJ component